MKIEIKGLQSEKVDLLIDELLNGLITDGGHHKQFHLEQALRIALDDQDYETVKREVQWEEGIPS